MKIRNDKWKIIYWHPAAWIALSLVLVHQCIIAGSSIFLTEVIERFQAGRDYFLYVYLYLLSMAIPYLPGCASFIFLQKWINEAHWMFVDKFIAQMSGRIEKYRDANLKGRAESVLARNSFPVVKDYISFVHDLASFSLNSVLGMLVIGFLLPPRLLWGYALSLLLCFFIVIGLRKLISVASAEYENKYIIYSGILDRSWENVTLGNKYNENIWRQRKSVSGHSFYAISYRLQILKQSGNVLLAVASLGPTIFLIASILHDGRAASAVIAAVIVSLTRIFLIINSLSALVYKFLDWSSMRARLDVLFDTGSSIAADEVLDGGVVGNIEINGTLVTGVTQVAQMVSQAGSGRFKITGANGSGKSTVLLALKNIFRDESFIFPAHHGDLMWKSDDATLSTGQKTGIFLKEIFELDGIKYLLLDEWDANLDGENRRAIDGILDEIGKSKTIVEVRH
ncbi:ABC transporter ATP-binding protein [Paraburkholderia sp. IW21]|uniref:ATP-binding cassette domain-containing protein n=1 Tax=Paraburkholderia sp. IW21 TaxID=3242488 RepID=UPI0035202FCA